MESSHTLSDLDELQKIMKRYIFFCFFRFFFGFFLPCVFVAISLHDQHIEKCKPPANAKDARICDITFPFHDHKLVPKEK